MDHDSAHSRGEGGRLGGPASSAGAVSPPHRDWASAMRLLLRPPPSSPVSPPWCPAAGAGGGSRGGASSSSSGRLSWDGWLRARIPAAVALSCCADLGDGCCAPAVSAAAVVEGALSVVLAVASLLPLLLCVCPVESESTESAAAASSCCLLSVLASRSPWPGSGWTGTGSVSTASISMSGRLSLEGGEMPPAWGRGGKDTRATCSEHNEHGFDPRPVWRGVASVLVGAAARVPVPVRAGTGGWWLRRCSECSSCRLRTALAWERGGRQPCRVPPCP